jgi:hypothetical protein
MEGVEAYAGLFVAGILLVVPQEPHAVPPPLVRCVYKQHVQMS